MWRHICWKCSCATVCEYWQSIYTISRDEEHPPVLRVDFDQTDLTKDKLFKRGFVGAAPLHTGKTNAQSYRETDLIACYNAE